MYLYITVHCSFFIHQYEIYQHIITSFRIQLPSFEDCKIQEIICLENDDIFLIDDAQRGRGGCSQGFGVAPRVLELLLGFWSCSQGFGVAPRVLELLPGFWSKNRKFIRPFMRSPIKRLFWNRKLNKGLCYPFFTLFDIIFAGKNRKFQSKLTIFV